MSAAQGTQVRNYVTTWVDAVFTGMNAVAHVGSSAHNNVHVRTTNQYSYPSRVFNQAARRLCALLSLTNQIAISLEALAIEYARSLGRCTNVRTEDSSPGTLIDSLRRGTSLYINTSWFTDLDTHLRRLREIRQANSNRSSSELLPDGSRYV
jgi:hypothetical protein